MRINDLCTQLFEGRHKVANRTFAHPGITIEDIVTLPQGQEGGQEARCRSGISDEELRFLRRDASAQAGYQHFSMGRVEPHVKTELPECSGEIARVVRKEGIVQDGCPFGQGGDQKGAVRHTLGTGDAHAGIQRV